MTETIYQSYVDGGLKVVGVGFDWNSPYSCEEWAQTFGLSYPVIDDSETAVIEKYATYVPWNVILDHNLVVRYTAYGRNEEGIVEVIKESLENLPTVGVEDRVMDGVPDIPSKVSLNAVYPNPFNSSTTIAYTLPRASSVTVDILDLKGRSVRTIQDRVEVSRGHHEVAWNSVLEPSGIYIVRLRSGNAVRTRKVLLVK